MVLIFIYLTFIGKLHDNGKPNLYVKSFGLSIADDTIRTKIIKGINDREKAELDAEAKRIEEANNLFNFDASDNESSVAESPVKPQTPVPVFSPVKPMSTPSKPILTVTPMRPKKEQNQVINFSSFY